MNLLVVRIARKEKYTIGRLYIDGVYFCDTIEDKDRGLTQDMSEEEIAKIKVKHATAIPTGVYKVTQSVKSEKYSKVKFYKDLCDGYLPRLLNVKGFDGILIHAGNTQDDTSGCILVGKNTVVGKVTESRATFTKLYSRIKGQDLKITIR